MSATSISLCTLFTQPFSLYILLNMLNPFLKHTLQYYFVCVGEHEGWKVVGLTRLSPIFPFTLLNYAYGVTKVKFSHYVLASWIGMMPGTILYVYVGSLGKAAASSNGKTPLEWTFYGLGLLATIIVTVYVTKIAKRALNKKIHA